MFIIYQYMWPHGEQKARNSKEQLRNLGECSALIAESLPYIYIAAMALSVLLNIGLAQIPH